MTDLWYLERDSAAAEACYDKLDKFKRHAHFARNFSSLHDQIENIQTQVSILNSMTIKTWHGQLNITPEIGTPDFDLDFDFIPVDGLMLYVSHNLREACGFKLDEVEYFDVNYASKIGKFVEKDYKLMQILNIDQPLDLEASGAKLKYPASEMLSAKAHASPSAKWASERMLNEMITEHGPKVIRADFHPKARVFIDRFSKRICITDEIKQRIETADLTGIKIYHFTERLSSQPDLRSHLVNKG